MPLTISYNNATLDIHPDFFSERLPASASPRDTGADSGDRLIRVRWRFAGTLLAGAPGALASARAGLLTALGTGGLDMILLESGVEVDRVNAADAVSGPALVSLEFPPASANAYRSGLDYRAVMEALVPAAAGATSAESYRLGVAWDEAGRRRMVKEGRVAVTSPDTLLDRFTAADPGTPAGFHRWRAEYEQDDAGRRLDYRYEDRETFKALPPGVAGGAYTRTESAADGVRRVEVAGTLDGQGARQWAESLRPDGSLVEETIEEDEFQQRVRFRFVSRQPALAGANLLVFSESLRFITTRAIVTHFPLRPGAPAYRQETGAPRSRVIQEGEAVGRASHPSPTAPLFPADLLETESRYFAPAPSASGEPAEYRVTWKHVMEPAVPPTARPPTGRSS